MNFDSLLTIVGDEPVFSTGLLLAGNTDPAYLRRQLSGWVNSGKLWQLRRGLYSLAPPYQKTKPHPFQVANRLVPGSYINLQAALAFHSLIPEHVAVITSVTTKKPGGWDTPLGSFIFRHIHPDLFFGYESVFVSRTQRAFVATPGKALLDLVHLQAQGDSSDYLTSLRLQNLDRLDVGQMRQLASRSGKPKLQRAAEAIAKLVTAESAGYEPL